MSPWPGMFASGRHQCQPGLGPYPSVTVDLRGQVGRDAQGGLEKRAVAPVLLLPPEALCFGSWKAHVTPWRL